ncbi:MAG: HEAT repeat domain-containing protein [Thiomargarita sp.]|nr:HEAT repeat domain-containing protein [Thiomargarita sp.]
MPLKNIIDWISLFSAIFLISTFFIPASQILLGITVGLLIFNYIMALRDLIHKGDFSRSLVILNVIQVILFCYLNVAIYHVLGHEHYSYAVEPRWYDWIELVAVHILRAIDFLDVLSAYNIDLQNVKHQSILSGLVLFSMHVMVDIFIFGKLFSDKPIRAAGQNVLNGFSFIIKTTTGFFMDIIHRSSIFAFSFAILFLILLVMFFERFDVSDIIFWFLENILRTLDVGDAFQIFEWQLHGGEMSLTMASVAVLFRLVASIYTIWLVKYFALIFFKGRGRTIEELLDIYGSPNSDKDADIALEALKKFDSEAVFSRLAMSIADKDWETRQAAADIIFLNKIDVQWPVNHSDILPYLLKGLGDKGSESLYIRAASAMLLGKMGRMAQDSFPQLVKALHDKEMEVRIAATEALGKIGKTAEIVVPLFLESFNDSKSKVRRMAALSLEDIGSDIVSLKKLVAPPLIDAFGDEDAEVRRAAIRTIGNIGPAASKVISRLILKLLDNNREVRRAVEIAMLNINPQWQSSDAMHRALPHLVKALKEGKERHLAAAALGKIGADAVKAVPYLINALADKQQDVCIASAFALGNLGEVAHAAIPYLNKLLQHSEWKMRSAAIGALKVIDPKGEYESR